MKHRNLINPLLSVAIGLACLLLLVALPISAANAAGQPGQSVDWPAAAPDTQALQATVGTTFTYQGRLIRGTRFISGTACNFQFGLYDTESVGSGAALGSGVQTANSVDMTDGYFTVDLNFGAVFTGTVRYLEVAIQCPGDSVFTTMDQRIAINPTPYALGVPWSGIYDVPSDLADGDGDSIGNLNCTQGQIPKWAGGSWSCDTDEGATVHAELGGLTTTDDHTQYLNVSGVRAMAGNLNVGGNKIRNLGQATGNGEAVRYEDAVKVADTAGGDLGNDYPNPSVIRIQGADVDSTAPVTDQLLIFNGSSWEPQSRGATGLAGGDLTGNYPDPTVAKIRGRSVSNNSPSSGQVLKWNGSTWLPQSPLDPADGNLGDLSGSYPNPTVTGIQGNPVSSNAPGNNQVLVFSLSSGEWTPSAVPSPIIAGFGISKTNNVISVDLLDTNSGLHFVGTFGDELAINPDLTTIGFNGSSQIRVLDGGISSAKIAANAVTNAKMADNSVDTAELVDDAVTIDKMADDSVNTDELVDDAVTTDKIAVGAVGSDEIADGAIRLVDIGQNSCGDNDVIQWNGTSWSCGASGGSSLTAGDGITITGNTLSVTVAALAGTGLEDDGSNNLRIQDNAITPTKIADNAVTTTKIADNAVTTTKIASAAVTSDIIANGTISFTDIGVNGCSDGEIIKLNSGSWGCSVDDSVASLTAGEGLVINGSTISVSLAASSGLTFTGGGDLQLADYGVTPTKIATDAVTTTKIADSAVTTTKIASAAVTSDIIANGTISFTDIGVNGCSPNEIIKLIGGSWTCAADDSVASLTAGEGLVINGSTISVSLAASSGLTFTGNNLQLADGGVTTARLADNAVTTAKITGSAVTTDKIAASAVTTTKIASAAVTSDKIANGTIQFEDIGQNSCADGQIIKLSGGNWGCTADDSGATLTAGEGLVSAGGVISVDLAASSGLTFTAGDLRAEFGAGNTQVARGDHDHFGQTWSGSGATGLTLNVTDTNIALRVVNTGTANIFEAENSGNRRFYVDSGGDVFADGGYNCGQTITATTAVVSDTLNNTITITPVNKSDLSPCLQDSSPADFAEMLPAANSPDDAPLEPGDVLVIDLNGQLARSSSAYQPTVVGVHSTRPSYLGNSQFAGDEAYSPLALVGVVPVKISAENGPVQPGDLLVASNTPGHAMRADSSAANGTIIGKALGRLPSGNGVIQMIVMLQ